jgi:hypothetical protein
VEKAAGRFSKKRDTNFLKDIMTAQISKQEQQIHINLKGIGISFVDSEPKEVLYISIYKINFEIKKITDTDMHGTKIETEVDLKIYHMQIDNQVP